MIIVTGGAGMIGSAFVWKLNEMGIKDILIVDKLRTENKWLNIRKREYYDWIDKDNLKEWLSCKENADKILTMDESCFNLKIKLFLFNIFNPL